MSQEQQKVEGLQELSTHTVSETRQATPEEAPEEMEINRKMTETGLLVPVSEAIKYRKRAQMAEQQMEQLKREGYDGFRDGTGLVVLKPENIRIKK